MNNDLSHIGQESEELNLPYVIWHPHFAEPETYEELAHLQPAMKAQAARACIIADHQGAYERINPTPDWFLVEAARRRAAATPFYHQDLQRRAQEMGIDLSEYPIDRDEWKLWEESERRWPRATFLSNNVSPTNLLDDWITYRLYDDQGVDMSQLELFVSASDELNAQARSSKDGLNLKSMYEKGRGEGGSS
ncbi:hypothetical protein BDV12DRAFT_202034 [Aspergillus spectabilis]